MTPDAPHNCGRPPPPGTAPHHPRGTQPPQGMQAKGTVLGPHGRTPAPTARGWRTPTARSEGGQSGEGKCLTSDAPHNGERHPTGDALPPPRQRATPARKSAHAVGPLLGPQARTNRTRDTRVAEPRLPAPEDGRPREGQRLTPDAPHNRGRPPPPGDGPPPPPRHAAPTGHASQGDSAGPPHPHTPTPAPTAREWRTPTARPSGQRKAPRPGDALAPPPERKGARCGAGAGSPRPHQPPPGHTGRRNPAARPGGSAAGGGTAPDTRRPSKRWQANPPGDGPPQTPRHAAPTGDASQGDSAGPPHPHTRAHSTWVADPDNPPGGQAVGGGERLSSDAPHNDGRHLPRGGSSATPAAHNAGPQARTPPPGPIFRKKWVNEGFENVFMRTPPILGALNPKNMPLEF